MAALLATGLGAVALVGGVAYVSVRYKVDSLRKQQAAEHFHTYMTAYLAEYGDWATAIKTESFDRFVRRQEGARTQGAELPSEMLERMPPPINDQARNATRAQEVSPAAPPAAGDGPPADPTIPAVRRSSGTVAPDGGLPKPDYRDAPPDPTLPAVRRPGPAAPAPGSAGPADPSTSRPAPGTPTGALSPDGYRPPRDAYGGPAEGRGQQGPRGDGYGGPPPEGRDQQGPRGDGYGGPPPAGRDQRGPRGDRYGGPPPESRERPQGGPHDGYGPPPEGREQRGPRDGYGPPPEGREQRGPRGDGYGGPPPEGRERPQGGPRDGYGGPRDGYGPPPHAHEQRGPRGEGHDRAQGAQRDGYGYGGPRPEDREQRPPRERDGQPLAERADRPQAGGGPLAGEAIARPDGSLERGPERDPERLPRGERPPRRDGPPPFRFVLADAEYKVLLGGGQFRVGETLPESARATSRPILVKDKTVAYVYSDGAPTPSPQEQKYIDALYNSLWWGIGAAASLATILGVLLSRGLSRSLSSLTAAVKGMHQGELRQQVPVKGKDEVAALASAFNEMSEQLAQSHEELNASHATILQQAEQLRELSIRDALTQLYNRRHFDEQANTLFNQAVRHKRPLALVICDIDHFKKINDTYSHATGDVVLRHVGTILRKHMRLSDLVARYGGEEFVMAFPETPGPQAAALCDKLRALIQNYPWHEVHPDLKVTMSMGVYADIAAGSAETMLQKADALLYRAKESGRNRVCFA